MANLIVKDSTLALIRMHEGYKSAAYWDYSRWSIGYGSGTLLNGNKVKETDRITKTEGESLLKRDAQYAAKYVNAWVKSAINQNMFDALVDFTYNCGIGNFQGSNLLKYVNANPLNFSLIRDAFLEPIWCTVNRTNRRKKEADIYSSASGTVNPSNIVWIVLIVVLFLFIKK